MHEFFESGVFIPYSPLFFPDESTTGFQSQKLLGLIFEAEVPWVGVSDVGLKPLSPQGETTCF